ncbi:MAG TPA: hypothetical protein VH008_07495 [Pseudonocardia sp.]|nr:hypothetical protein [Pseudonocardia sp.]
MTCEEFGDVEHPGGERAVTPQRRAVRGRGTGRRRPNARNRTRFTRLVVIVAGLLLIIALVISAMPPLPIAAPAQPTDTSAPPQP